MSRSSQQGGSKTAAAALRSHRESLPAGNFQPWADHYRIELDNRIVYLTSARKEPRGGRVAAAGATAPLLTIDAPQLIASQQQSHAALLTIEESLEREAQQLNRKLSAGWLIYRANLGLILLTCIGMTWAFIRSAEFPAEEWTATVMILAPVVLVVLFVTQALLMRRFKNIRAKSERLLSLERSLEPMA